MHNRVGSNKKLSTRGCRKYVDWYYEVERAEMRLGVVEKKWGKETEIWNIDIKFILNITSQ